MPGVLMMKSCLKQVAPAHYWQLPLQRVCLAPLLANENPRREYLYEKREVQRNTLARLDTLSSSSFPSHNQWTVPLVCKNVQDFKLLVNLQSVLSPPLDSEWVTELQVEVE